MLDPDIIARRRRVNRLVAGMNEAIAQACADQPLGLPYHSELIEATALVMMQWTQKLARNVSDPYLFCDGFGIGKAERMDPE